MDRDTHENIGGIALFQGTGTESGGISQGAFGMLMERQRNALGKLLVEDQGTVLVTL